MQPFPLLPFFLVPLSWQGLHVVDGGSLQAAVSAAADGDVLLVKSGDYAQLQVSGKSLTVIADEGAFVNVSGVAWVRNLPATQQVSLVGITFSRGLEVATCGGNVWIQDCTARGLGASSPGLLVRSSDRVVVLNSEARGGSGSDCVEDPIVGTHPEQHGGPGAHIVDSRIAVHDSTFVGGMHGSYDFNPYDHYCWPDGHSGAGVLLSGTTSELLLAGSEVLGGAGLCIYSYTDSCSCSDGAVGLQVDSGTAHVLDSTIRGGSGGRPGAWSSCTYFNATVDGLPVLGTADLLRGDALRLTVGTPRRAGGTTPVLVEGPPHALIRLAIGAVPRTLPLIDTFRGFVLVGDLISLEWIGSTDANGRLSLDLPVGDLGGLEVTRTFLQVGTIDLNGPRPAAGSPKAARVPIQPLLGGGAMLVQLHDGV